MSGRLKKFTDKIAFQNQKLSSILPYAREEIVNLRRVQDGIDTLKIKLWKDSQTIRRMAEIEPNFDSMFLSKRNQKFSSKTRLLDEETEINIDNFKAECEKKFGWQAENPESLKNGRCMIEIITNIGEI